MLRLKLNNISKRRPCKFENKQSFHIRVSYIHNIQISQINCGQLKKIKATWTIFPEMTAWQHPIFVYWHVTIWQITEVDNTWASYQIRKIAGAHAPGMPGTFSPSPQVSDPDMHHGTCVTHVPWCKPGSLTSGLLWNRRRGKTFPAFLAHAQPAILRIW